MSETTDNRDEPRIDSRIIPVMREGVLMVQMILFRTLKENIRCRYQDWPSDHHTWLAGAVVNNLFGYPLEPEVADFARRNRELVEEELRGLAGRCSSLVPHLTDALRMKTICDNQEGIHSIPSLLMARTLGLLQEERPLPLPSTFMTTVRQLAAEHGLVEPMQPQPTPAASKEEPFS